MSDVPSPRPRRKIGRGMKVVLGLFVGIVVMVIGALGVLFIQGQIQQRARRAQAAVEGPEAVPVMMVTRMKRPPKPLQQEVLAYFSPGNDLPVDMPAAYIVKQAKAGKLSLVITCHGDDAVEGDKPAALADRREQTIERVLIASGMDSSLIMSSWGDPSIRSQSGYNRTNPQCEIETALRAS